MTKQDAIREHRKMWRWIAVETLKRERKVQKRDYFRSMGISACDRPFSNCFCCEYAEKEQTTYQYICESCPIYWPSSRNMLQCCDKNFLGDGQSLFNLWENEKDYKKAALLAYKISKLPEKKKKKKKKK